MSTPKTVVPYEPWHLGNLAPNLQAKQILTKTEEDALSGSLENSWSLSDGTDIYCIIGVESRDQGVGRAWALFSQDSGKDIRKIIRAVRLWLSSQVEYHRVEIVTRVDFPEAAHFAQLCGFTFESKLSRYTYDHVDVFIWSHLPEDVW
jgi:hypothetical protein